MHFVSIGNLIIMLLFWVGSYLVTIWLMSLLFPAMPAIPDKKGEKPELLVGDVSGIDRQLSASPLEPFCTQLGADSGFDISKNMRQGAVVPRIDYKRHIGG